VLHVLAACPCNMFMLQVHQCISKLQILTAHPRRTSMLHVQVACKYCFSLLNFRAICPGTCFMSMLYVCAARFFHFSAACPSSISMLYVRAACPCTC
jgi:hypothetical protein